MKVLDRIHGRLWAMLLLATGTAFTSCDGILEEEEMDCSYTVRFKYDMNIKFADAFANEVKSVALYAFKDNKLVYQQVDDDIPAMETNTYVMHLDGLKSGEYDIITWAGDKYDESFVVPLMQEGDSMEKLTCMMNRNHGQPTGRAEGEGSDAYIDEYLNPLFHGKIHHEFHKGDREALIPLTKNTNTVRIILQQLNGKPVDFKDFEFTITDENGTMNYDNSIMDDEILTYYAWTAYSGSAGINNPESEATTSISVAIAEFTTGRLMADLNPILRIYNKGDNDLLVSIPLKDYALLVKGDTEYSVNRNMTDQEYLDRQDEYNMTFFIDDKEWINSVVIINSWRKVLQNSEL